MTNLRVGPVFDHGDPAWVSPEDIEGKVTPDSNLPYVGGSPGAHSSADVFYTYPDIGPDLVPDEAAVGRSFVRASIQADGTVGIPGANLSNLRTVLDGEGADLASTSGFSDALELFGFTVETLRHVSAGLAFRARGTNSSDFDPDGSGPAFNLLYAFFETNFEVPTGLLVYPYKVVQGNPSGDRWANPENAFAAGGGVASLTGDGFSTQWYFPAITVDDIPDSSTIDRVRLRVGTAGGYLDLRGPVWPAEVGDNLFTQGETTGRNSFASECAVTLEMLRAGDITALVVNNDVLSTLDYVRLEIDFTPPEPEPEPEPELEPVFHNGSVIPGKTPEQVAAYLIAAPEWHFTDSPWKAVGYATTTAMTAAVAYRHDHARFFTRVAVILVPAANNPHVYLGAGMADLREKYRV